MKKLLLMTVSIFVLTSSAFALNLAKTSPAIPIQGYVDMYHSMTIDTLESSSTTEDTGLGMPFNLEWPSLAYTSILGTGRPIGRWTLTSNYTPIMLTIKANPMSTSASSDVVNYCLDFHYSILVFDSTTFKPTGEVKEGDFRVESGTTWDSSNTAPFNTEVNIPVITVDQDVRFCLANGTVVDDIKPGIYKGTVTMTVVGE